MKKRWLSPFAWPGIPSFKNYRFHGKKMITRAEFELTKGINLAIIFLAKMGIKRIIAVSFFPLLLASFLFSQSLVEVAKKEKERRDSLKGKKAVVVTNADLGKLKKKPSLTMLEAGRSEIRQEAESGEEIGEERKVEVPEVYEEVPAKVRTIPETEAAPTLSGKSLDEQKVELEDRWNKAREYVDLLTTKMNGLWQKFYALDDMISRDSIQQEISDTYVKLLKAQENEAKAKEELDKLLASRRR